MYLLITRSNCPYCVKAKELLNSKKVPYVAINLDSLSAEEQATWRQHLKYTYEHTTVPAVFNFIGGYEQLTEIENLKELF